MSTPTFFIIVRSNHLALSLFTVLASEDIDLSIHRRVGRPPCPVAIAGPDSETLIELFDVDRADVERLTTIAYALYHTAEQESSPDGSVPDAGMVIADARNGDACNVTTKVAA